MDTDKVDLLIRFAVACAAEHEDWRSNSLRPIHILKYVYLADLGYAAKNHGATFTGAPWEFHFFGPWCQAIFARIPIALAQLPFESREIETDNGDTVAYFTKDKELVQRMDPELPIAGSRPMKRDMLRFGAHTNDLLDHVYKTGPMLRAAPLERLDFAYAVPEIEPSAAAEPQEGYAGRKHDKKREEKLRDLKRRVAERLQRPRDDGRVRVTPTYPPEVVAALDALWQQPDLSTEESTSGILSFAEDVWQSPSRSDDELP